MFSWQTNHTAQDWSNILSYNQSTWEDCLWTVPYKMKLKAIQVCCINTSAFEYKANMSIEFVKISQNGYPQPNIDVYQSGSTGTKFFEYAFSAQNAAGHELWLTGAVGEMLCTNGEDTIFNRGDTYLWKFKNEDSTESMPPFTISVFGEVFPHDPPFIPYED